MPTMDDEKKRKVLFVSLAVVIFLGLVLIVTACVIANGSLAYAWVVPLLLISPLPNLFVSQIGGGPFAAGPALGVQEAGKFLTGMLVTSVLIFPWFLYHLHYATYIHAAMAFVGAVFISIAMLIFQLSFNTEESGGM